LEIVLVRHAQPDWEPGGRSVDDPGLTKLGHIQAERAARRLADEHFDHIYRSPLLRVRETADPICRALGQEPIELAWLRELGLPSLAGQTSEQVQRYFADAHARSLEHWADGLPGGESFRHFSERVAAGIEGLLDTRHSVQVHEQAAWRIWQIPEEEERILIIAHEGTNAALLSHLLGIEPVPWTWLRFSGAWAGIHRIHSVRTGSGCVWSLEQFNSVSHLQNIDPHSEGNGRSFQQ
jgi:broad specificity phosphatase PhoE